MSYSPRQKHTPEQWQQLVEAQAVSDQTQVAFCADHDLSKSSFQHWKRRLRSNGAAASAAEPALFTLVQVGARDGRSRLIQPGCPACLQSIEARNERRMRSRIVRRLRMGGP